MQFVMLPHAATFEFRINPSDHPVAIYVDLSVSYAKVNKGFEV